MYAGGTMSCRPDGARLRSITRSTRAVDVDAAMDLRADRRADRSASIRQMPKTRARRALSGMGSRRRRDNLKRDPSTPRRE